MSIKNRELSQFGSFIYVDDSTKTVGIATTESPYIGIGTQNATHKLTVVGDANFSGNANVTGIVSATSYFLNGNLLVNPDISTWAVTGPSVYRSSGNVGIGSTLPQSKLDVIGDVNITGVITATNIFLSGLQISSGIVTASRFISTVTTGTSPFEVTSQTLVSNLNADYLRGGVPGSNVNSFDIVTLGANQTLSNKTLIFPTFEGNGVVFNGSTSGTITLRANAIAGGGTLTLPTTTGALVSTGDNGVVTSDMISDLTITNGDISATAGISYGKLNLTNSITNTDIVTGAGISISKLSASTISGVSLGSNLANLTAGSFVNYSSGTTYNGSSDITISIAATSTNTVNTIVSRNPSGDFAAGTVNLTNLTASQTIQADAFVGGTNGGNILITGISTLGITSATSLTSQQLNVSGVTSATNLTSQQLSVSGISTFAGITTVTGATLFSKQLNVSGVSTFSGIATHTAPIFGTQANFTGVVTATDFNSTSDFNLKTNIKTIENSLDTITQLRGVTFDWKNTGTSSIGVIAQELEKVLPQLVTEGNPKTVNYNGLIGVLIESVKELSAEIQELKNNK